MSLQKYTVFHGYFEGIHEAVAWISLIFAKFPSTLVPFSQIRNHMMKECLLQEYMIAPEKDAFHLSDIFLGMSDRYLVDVCQMSDGCLSDV